MGWLDSITNSMDMSLSKLWETVKETGACHATVHGVSKSLTDLTTEKQLKAIEIFSKSLSSHRQQIGWGLCPLPFKVLTRSSLPSSFNGTHNGSCGDFWCPELVTITFSIVNPMPKESPEVNFEGELTSVNATLKHL